MHLIVSKFGEDMACGKERCDTGSRMTKTRPNHTGNTKGRVNLCQPVLLVQGSTRITRENVLMKEVTAPWKEFKGGGKHHFLHIVKNHMVFGSCLLSIVIVIDTGLCSEHIEDTVLTTNGVEDISVEARGYQQD